MLRPYESSLVRDDRDLGEVLAILSIAHKYRAHSIEERARPIAVSMTRPGVIRSYMGSRISAMEIVEIGISVECKDIADSAFEIVMDQVKRKELPAHKALSFAERIKAPGYIARVYYQLMMRGSRGWEKDVDLTERQRWNASRGSIRCMEEWDSISRSLKAPLQDHECPNRGHRCGIEFLAKLTKHYVDRGIGSSDVIGRLEVVADFELEADQPSLAQHPRGNRVSSGPIEAMEWAGEAEYSPVDDVATPLHSVRYESHERTRPHLQTESAPIADSTVPQNNKGSPVTSIGCSTAFKVRASKHLREIQSNLPDYFIDFVPQQESTHIDMPPAPEPAPIRVGRYLASFWSLQRS